MTRRLAYTLLLLSAANGAFAADLVISPSFAALASDRIASQIGDSLNVLVIETSSAARANAVSTKRGAHITADAYDGSGPTARAQANYGGGFDGRGENIRSGNLVAQLTVSVEAIAPNGDLIVAGEQLLRIDGEKTRIRLHGRARPADISTANTIVSSRLSDVSIDYDGRGFATRSGRPGLVASILNWLGLL